METKKTELTQEELTNVTGGGYGAGDIGGDSPLIGNGLQYGSEYPYYLNVFFSNITGCQGFKGKLGALALAYCADCTYFNDNHYCTLRTKDNDPYA